MSSYQIKSTPYFQRMLTKSKRNGELQRLKEEYERIKDFNDHTISMRIRQVRLRRLFREIQDINTAVSARIRPRRTPQKSFAQMRAEELSKARELGTEYSRENAMRVTRYDAFGTHSSTSVFQRRSQLEARPSSTARRLQYGNSMSAYNMKKFRQTQMKSYERTSASVPNELNCVSSGEIDKMEKLHERVTYKNSGSSSHVTHQQHNNSKAETGEFEAPQDAAGGELRQHPTSRPDVVKNYTFLLDDEGNINIDDTAMEYIRAAHELDDDDDDEQYIPIANVLRNAPQLFRNLKVAETAGRDRYQEIQEIIEEDFDSLPDEVEEENALRKISNDRNLPLSNFRKFVLPAIESIDDAQIIENEELIKVSKLDEKSSGGHEDMSESANQEFGVKVTVTKSEAPAYEQLTPKAFFAEKSENEAPSLKNKPLPTQTPQPQSTGLMLHHEVKEFVKLYEPFPHDDEEPAPVKENFESGVAKLRSIFEHQGE